MVLSSTAFSSVSTKLEFRNWQSSVHHIRTPVRHVSRTGVVPRPMAAERVTTTIEALNPAIKGSRSVQSISCRLKGTYRKRLVVHRDRRKIAFQQALGVEILNFKRSSSEQDLCIRSSPTQTWVSDRGQFVGEASECAAKPSRRSVVYCSSFWVGCIASGALEATISIRVLRLKWVRIIEA